MNKSFKIDIQSVNEYGVEDWQNKFFWPVSSPDLYNKILSELDIGYRKIIASVESDVIRENMIARYKALLEYSNLLYTSNVIQELRSRGLNISYKGDENYFHYILKDSFSEDGLHLKWHTLKTKYSLVELLRDRKNVLKTEVKYCVKSLRFISKKTDGKLNMAFQPSHFTYEYVKRHLPGRILFLSNSIIVSKCNAVAPHRYILESDYISKLVADMVNTVASKNGIYLTKNAKAFIYEVTKKKFLESLEYIYIIVESLKKFKSPLRLFMSTPGRHTRRFVSAAINLRNDESEVVGFAHGEYTGHDLSSHYIAINLGNINSFGVYGKAMIPLVEKTMNLYPEYIRPNTKIFSSETDFFKNKWEINKKKEIPKKINKVMLMGVGYSENSTWITKNLPSQLVSLDFEIRVINFMQKHGFKIIYKAHPSSRGLINFLHSYVRTIYDPFESVLDMADAYLFYRPMTTTFLEAFCTKLPIIYLHNQHIQRDWGNDFELIRKRCAIVPTLINELNRLEFNEDKLLAVLEKRPEEPNTEFIRKYLFPSD